MQRFAILTIVIFSMSFFDFFSAKGSDKVETPDFDFPATVVKNAQVQLKEALKAGNVDLAGNALLQLARAQEEISPDSIVTVIKRTRQIRQQSTDGLMQSVMAMLEAKFLEKYYNRRRWQLQGSTEVESDSTEITLWAVPQFKYEIARLCSLAVIPNQKLLATSPTETICDVIKIDDDSRQLYGSALSSVGTECLNLLKKIGANNIFDDMEVPTDADGEVKSVAGSIIDCMDRNIAEGTPERVGLIMTETGLGLNVDAPTQCSLYEANKSTPFAGLILLTPYAYKANYKLMKDFVDNNGNFVFIDKLKAELARLEKKEVRLFFPSQVATGLPMTVKVKVENLNDIDIDVYYSNSYGIAGNGNDVSAKDLNRTFKKIATLHCHVDGEMLFEGETELSYVPDNYGVYTFLAKLAENSNNNYRLMRCSDLTTMALQGYGCPWLYAVDLISGAPQSGVNFSATRGWSSKNISTFGPTNKAGLVKVENMKEWVNYYPIRGRDRFAAGLASGYLEPDEKERVNVANINTSLAVYRPGDKMEWSVIVFGSEGNLKFVGNDLALNVTLHDVNHKQLAEVEVTTDAMGRARGEFDLPEGGLTGYYYITANCAGRRIGGRNVLVSDYKLPTFEVKLDSMKMEDSLMVIKGAAITYAGFPVQVASAELELKNDQRFAWWRGNSDEKAVIKVDVEFDADGAMTFRMLREDLNKKLPYPDGLLSAKLTVVATSGESHEASMTIALAKRMHIVMGYMDNINASQQAELPVFVCNSLGEEVVAPVELTFTQKGAEGKTYRFKAETSTDKLQLDLSSLPSGTYLLKAVGLTDEFEKDDNDADSSETEIVVYRDDDVLSPSLKLLWTPKTLIEPGANGKAEFKVGTKADKTYILKAVTCNAKIISTEWLVVAPGMHVIEVEIPDGENDAEVTLMTINDGESDEVKVSLHRPDPTSQLKVEIENLRKVTTSGAEETLTIKLTDAAGTLRSGAAFLDIYSKAVDAIQSYRLNLAAPYIYKGSVSSRVVAPTQQLNSSSYTRKVKMNRRLEVPQLFYLNEYTAGVYLASSSKMMVRGVSITESVEEDCVADNMQLAECIVENSFDSGSGNAQEEEVTYRPAEVPLALFAPDILIGEEGKAEIKWTVPDANTTWAMNLAAWTVNALTANWTGEIVSSKPIMVSVNVPRFLRQGDEVELVSTINNATDSVADCIVVVKFCNPFTDEEVCPSITSKVEIEPRKSAVVTSPLKVATDWSGVVVKVSVKAGNYTDAEMHTVPVLAASQRVVDSSTFYLAPDEDSYSVVQEKEGSDSDVALTFTANPIWEVVSALPVLRADGHLTSPSTASSLFALVVAHQIIRENPEVAKGIATMAAEQRKSKLGAESSIAQLDLASTPWVQVAVDENEQLSRLYAILDEMKVKSELIKMIDNLRDFQNSDGGFRWSNGFDESSVWATQSVLEAFAQLIDMGCELPEGTSQIIINGMSFLENNVREMLKKQPLGHDTTFATLCASFKFYAPGNTAERANERAYKAMAEQWKNSSITEKAYLARVLNRVGYEKVANEILASITEFSTYNKKQGRFFDGLSAGPAWARTPLRSTAEALEAFAQINPDSEVVDQLRQWLLLAKLTTGWGDSRAASAAISAIIGSGSKWTSIGDSVTITVDGSPIDITTVDKLSGTVETRLSSDGGNLKITRQSAGPAWGAIVVESTKAMRNIKASSTDELSIEKQILANRAGKWRISNQLQLGETVKVRLIIDSKRIVDYVTIVDNRAATFEPEIVTPHYVYSGGLGFYLENRDAATNLFIDRLPKGKFVIEYEMKVNNRGDFSAGVATLQSQMAPEFTAHSASAPIIVK